MAAESGCVVCTHRADDSAASSCEAFRLQQAGIDRNARAGRVAQRRRGLLRVKNFSVRPSRAAVTDGRECDGEAAGGLAIHGGELLQRPCSTTQCTLYERQPPTPKASTADRSTQQKGTMPLPMMTGGSD